MAKLHITTTINGDAIEFLCEPEQTLLDVLRDELQLTGSKEGCGSGDCGACSVMLDDRLVCSCLVLGAEAGPHGEIRTIEGVMARRRAAASAAAQVPGARGPAVRHLHAGLLVAAKALLDRESGPERDRGALLAGRQPLPLHRLRQDRARGPRRGAREMRRRGGMPLDVKPEGPGPSQAANCFSTVGTRPLRPDGVDKVTGPRPLRRRHDRAGHADRQDPAQPASPCPDPRHRRLQGREALPGVKAVVTRDDFQE